MWFKPVPYTIRSPDHPRYYCLTPNSKIPKKYGQHVPIVSNVTFLASP